MRLLIPTPVDRDTRYRVPLDRPQSLEPRCALGFVLLFFIIYCV